MVHACCLANVCSICVRVSLTTLASADGRSPSTLCTARYCVCRCQRGQPLRFDANLFDQGPHLNFRP
jgi:hypothetical protein